MSIQQIFQLVKTALPYVIGAIGGIISLMASGFSKEYFDERKRRARHKINVARHVLKICTEASTGNFKQPPRDMEHIYSVLTNVEGIDKQIGEAINIFVSRWILIVEFSEKKAQRKSEEKHHFQMLNEVEEKRKVLVLWANKIRAG